MVCHDIYLKFIKSFEIFDSSMLPMEKLGNQGIHLNFQIENWVINFSEANPNVYEDKHDYYFPYSGTIFAVPRP